MFLHRPGGVLLRATAARSGGLCSDLRRGRRRTKGQGRSRLLAMVRCERVTCSGFAHCLPIRDVRRRSSSPEFRALGRQSCECANSAWVTNVTSLRAGRLGWQLPEETAHTASGTSTQCELQLPALQWRIEACARGHGGLRGFRGTISRPFRKCGSPRVCPTPKRSTFDVLR